MASQTLNWARAHKRPLIAVAAVIMAVAFSVAGYVSLRLPKDDCLHQDVLLEGKAVGGLTRAEARGVLETEVAQVVERKVRLTAHGQQWTYTCKQLGVLPQIDEAIEKAYQVGRTGSLIERARMALNPYPQKWEIGVRYTFDKSAMEEVLHGLQEQVRVPAKDASATLKGEVVQVEPGRWGESLDVESSSQKLREALADPREAVRVELVLNSHKPRVSYEDLKHLDCVLAQYSTRYNPSKVNRTHNLKLAGACIDGTLLRPADTFSYNAIVGRRELERGYRPAPIFADGDVVDEVGGGICQVASTCYNVALLAGLEIVQRRPHSRPVDYCPVGRDATVYFGQVDLKFRNNTELPIYLRTTVAKSRVRITAFGNKSQKADVELVPFDYEVIPFKETRKEDPTLAAGKEEEDQEGRNGVRLSMRRLIKRGDGAEVKEIVSRDYYKPQERKVRVGTKAEEAPTTEAASDGGAARADTKGTPPSRPTFPRIEDQPEE